MLYHEPTNPRGVQRRNRRMMHELDSGAPDQPRVGVGVIPAGMFG